MTCSSRLTSSPSSNIWCWTLFFFFFQAEDGIRDDLVTGVQTCALPIYGFAVLLRRGHAHARRVDRIFALAGGNLQVYRRGLARLSLPRRLEGSPARHRRQVLHFLLYGQLSDRAGAARSESQRGQWAVRGRLLPGGRKARTRSEGGASWRLRRKKEQTYRCDGRFSEKQSPGTA